MQSNLFRAVAGLGLIATLAIVLAFGCSSDKKSVNPPGNGGGPGDDTLVGDLLAGHTVTGDYTSIPQSIRELVHDSLRIFYGHTSHGSQLVSGLDMIQNEDATFVPPTIHEVSDDLGLSGDTTWVAPTRSWLNGHPEYNVVIWSWCGGVSDNSEQGINTYLNAMSDLEADYPNVKFIYMTGHLDGSGVDGNLYARNNQIRAYCAANEKILFDFADIESYDPDGNYYPDASDACEWAEDWCAQHDCPSCGSCAHSHCFNCYQKGKAFWWLLSRLVGWEG